MRLITPELKKAFEEKLNLEEAKEMKKLSDFKVELPLKMDFLKEDDLLRCEALKLAYDVALKADELNRSRTPEQRYEALLEVFKLATANYLFMKDEKTDISKEL